MRHQIITSKIRSLVRKTVKLAFRTVKAYAISALSKEKPSKQRWGDILFVDQIHLNRKNFESLFDCCNKLNANINWGVKQNSEQLNLILDPTSDKSRHLCQSYNKSLKKLKFEELVQLVYGNVNIVDAALDEALSIVLPKENWQKNNIKKNKNELIKKLYDEDKNTFLQCCSSAMFWVDYWRNFPKLNKYKCAFVFSGSQIYNKTLLKLLSYTPVECFVCESFFTGSDYYLENRHSPIANSSTSCFPNVYRRMMRKLHMDTVYSAQAKIKATNKINGMINKNVTQPDQSKLPLNLKEVKIALVIGQVCNDFSLISGKGDILTSIPVYKDLVRHLLKDDRVSVIFKAHPWERKKDNIRSSITRDAMEDFQKCLDQENRRRFIVMEDFNLKQLLRNSDAVFTLCSQSALEAAAEGLKPYTIGGAFYDVGGFTNPFREADGAVKSYISGATRGTLSIEEYENFLSYLAGMLEIHLVDASALGVDKIINRITRKKQQKHLNKPYSELSITSQWG